MSMMRVYVFETSARLIEELPPEKRGKTTIKYTAMFFLLLHGVLGRALAPGDCMINDNYNIPLTYIICAGNHTFLLKQYYTTNCSYGSLCFVYTFQL